MLKKYTKKNKMADLSKDKNSTVKNIGIETILKIHAQDEKCSGALIHYKIHKFSKLKKSMYSQGIQINNEVWKIMIMPCEEDGVKTFGFYLKCCKTDKEPWTCRLYTELHILAALSDVQSISNQMVRTFTSERPEWGYSNFIEWNNILNESNGFIKNDTVTLQVVLFPNPFNVTFWENEHSLITKLLNERAILIDRNDTLLKELSIEKLTIAELLKEKHDKVDSHDNEAIQDEKEITNEVSINHENDECTIKSLERELSEIKYLLNCPNDKRKLEIECNELRKEINTTNDKNLLLIDEKCKLKAETEKLKEKLDTIQDFNYVVQKENIRLKQQLADCDKELNAVCIGSDTSKIIQERVKETDRLIKLQIKSEEIDTLKTQVEETNSQVLLLKQELIEIKTDRTYERQELEDKYKELNNHLSAVQKYYSESKDDDPSAEDDDLPGEDEHFSGEDEDLSGKDEYFYGDEGDSSEDGEHFSGEDEHFSGKDECFYGDEGDSSEDDEHFSGEDEHFSGEDEHFSGEDEDSSGEDEDSSGEDENYSLVKGSCDNSAPEIVKQSTAEDNDRLSADENDLSGEDDNSSGEYDDLPVKDDDSSEKYNVLSAKDDDLCAENSGNLAAEIITKSTTADNDGSRVEDDDSSAEGDDSSAEDDNSSAEDDDSSAEDDSNNKSNITNCDSWEIIQSANIL